MKQAARHGKSMLREVRFRASGFWDCRVWVFKSGKFIMVFESDGRVFVFVPESGTWI